MTREIEQAAEWMEKIIAPDLYGEVGIRFTIHAGKIKRTERLIVTKEKQCDAAYASGRGKYGRS